MILLESSGSFSSFALEKIICYAVKPTPKPKPLPITKKILFLHASVRDDEGLYLCINVDQHRDIL